MTSQAKAHTRKRATRAQKPGGTAQLTRKRSRDSTPSEIFPSTTDLNDAFHIIRNESLTQARLNIINAARHWASAFARARHQPTMLTEVIEANRRLLGAVADLAALEANPTMVNHVWDAKAPMKGKR